MPHSFTIKTYLLILCISLSACSPSIQGNNTNSKVPKEEYRMAWSNFMTSTISSDSEAIDVQSIAEQLQSLVSENSQAWLDAKAYKNSEVLTPALSENNAKRERQYNRYKLLLFQLATTYGKKELHRISQQVGPYDPKQAADEAIYIASLEHLLETMPVLENGGLDVYYADNAEGVFAYSRQNGSARAYIALNFSFNTQEMPLPFGFMASTKVAVWQSDSVSASGNDIERFVTQQAISVQAFSGKVVIVE